MTDADAGLVVDGLTVAFGGLKAVDDASFAAARGTITGLIGPNGAGKTTTFNACSGVHPPTAGRVLFDGRDVSGVSPQGRARLGLGRTFQRMELFDSLTVRENVELGHEAGLAGSSAVRQVFARSSERRETRAAAQEALALAGIERMADRGVGALSTGERRLVELARVLAGRFTLLLLDEPSSGLDVDETRAFGDILGRVVAERGVGILLVEHDMSLVLGICETIHVLDFGRLIFTGSAQEARDSELVRAAYLGATV
ncbi:MAG: ABC transporter ATP-binding protein [Actinomycetota bacterium]|nr:ABC transporter ATP-binding protein [Actinomycetota bacterium]